MTTAVLDVKFLPYEESHGRHIADKMRLSDRKEMYYMAAVKPHSAIEMSTAMSREVTTALVNDEPCLLFGIGTRTWFSTVGVPWLLGTDLADQYQYRFARFSKKFYAELDAAYDEMENYVWVENTKTIRWLKWLGFEMQEPEKYGVFDQEFIRFGKGL